MARYILAVSIESDFYREYHEEGHPEDELLEELVEPFTRNYP